MSEEKTSRRSYVKYVGGAVVVAVVAAAGYGIYEYTRPKKSEMVLGCGASLTGIYAAPGSRLKKALDLWVELKNKEGGIYIADLRTRIPVRQIVYDDKSDATTSLAVYKKLITVDNVDFLLGPYSILGLSVGPLAEESKVPLIFPITPMTTLWKKGYKYIHTVTATSEDLGYYVTDFAKEVFPKLNPPIKTIALCAEDNPGPLEYLNIGRKEFKAMGLEIVHDELWATGTTDFTPLLMKIKAKNPDALFAYNYPGTAIYMARQMKEIGFRPKLVYLFLGPQSPEFRAELKSDGNYALGVSYWENYMPESWSRGITHFNTVFKEKYGDLPTNFEAEMWASLELLDNAIQKAGSADKEKVNKAIRELDYYGLFGRVKLDENGANKGFLTPPSRAAVHVQVQNEKPQIVHPPEAATAPLMYPAPRWA